MNYDYLFKRAKELNISEIEVYTEEKAGLDISLFNGVVDKNVMFKTTGVALRGLYNGQMGYVSSEYVDDDKIDYLLERLIDNAKVLTIEEKSFIYEGSENYPEVEERALSFTEVSTWEKVKLLQELEKKIKEKDIRIASVANCMYKETKVTIEIRNSKGLNLKKTDGYCFVYASAVAKDESDVKSGSDYRIVKNFSEINLDKLAESIVKRAVGLLNATPVESKKYPVILENEVFADILGAFQAMFSGESVLKKLTLLKDKLDEQVANTNITIVDDPLCQDAYVQQTFDDEGVSCYRKEIISKGVFKTFLHNLKTAHALNTQSTGNGFKAGLNSPVGVRYTNLYVEKGYTSLEDMIKGTEEGLLITDVQGLHSGVNPISGDFSLQASGYLIQNGVIAKPVTLIVIAGNFLELLKNVEEVGNDLVFTYQQIGCPSIKVSSLQVSGE
ncbi:MAG: TldD/PmbA family protein [Bacilli bacterium]|nr:TldD/PmbA family protein [Bacilli bacterium]